VVGGGGIDPQTFPFTQIAGKPFSMPIEISVLASGF